MMNGDTFQLGLPGVADTYAQQFDVWAHTPGGRKVMQYLFRIAYPYARRYLRTGRQVSVKLLWEVARDHIQEVRRRLQVQGQSLENWEGYSLNNIFTAYVARFIVEHRPEWSGMFETRQVQKERTRRPVFIRAGIVLNGALA